MIKKMQSLLLLICLLSAISIVAQTSSTLNRAAHNQAQQLKPYNPPMRSVEKKLGEDTLSISIGKDISPATEQALIEYFTQHYKISMMAVEMYKVPGADNLYFVLGTVLKDKQSPDSEAVNILLLLKEEGTTVSEVSQAMEEIDFPVRAPLFFFGHNRVLAVFSLSAVDGSLFGHVAYEYADNKLKPLSSIPVIDKLGMSGQVWVTNNQIEKATAEYKDNTYYLTVRGKGSLYQDLGNSKYKKLATPGAPVTFIYDGKEWRPVAAKQAKGK